MEQDVLNRYEEKGLPCSFFAKKAGEVVTARGARAMRDTIAQVGLIIFETIGALGDIKIDKMEILGEAKGVIILLDGEMMLGSLFNRTQGLVMDDLWTLLGELKQHMAVAARAPEQGPIEKPKTVFAPSILTAIQEIMQDYLGDFTERIFKNQFAAHGLTVNKLYEDDIRRFIVALGKAGTMIIGPSKGRAMKEKLLKLLK